MALFRSSLGVTLFFGIQHFGAVISQSFSCPISQPAKTAPTNATDVHPGHISVVMAMGDSMTAAFAAESLFDEARPALRSSSHVQDAPLEFRELSFSIGQGSESHLTLPYFLSHYNASLTGFGTQRTLPQLPSTGYLQESADALNVALSNAHTWELKTEVDELKKKTRNIPDFDQRWKLLTILIGANDVCDGMGTGFEACDGNVQHAAALLDRAEYYLRSTLQALQDSMQNIVIQLMSLFSISSVHQARANHKLCNLEHHFMDECNCIDRTAANGKAGSISQEQLALFDRTVEGLNERIQKLVLEFNLRRPDFAVINVVAAKNQPIPDLTYVSQLDCFHPSAKAHSALARALWNGLFEKQRVPTPMNASLPLFCPKSDSVIYVGERMQADRLIV